MKNNLRCMNVINELLIREEDNKLTCPLTV